MGNRWSPVPQLGQLAQIVGHNRDVSMQAQQMEEQREYEKEQRDAAWKRQDQMIAGDRAYQEEQELASAQRMQEGFMMPYQPEVAGQQGSYAPTDPSQMGENYSPRPTEYGGDTQYTDTPSTEAQGATYMGAPISETMDMIAGLGEMDPLTAKEVIPYVQQMVMDDINRSRTAGTSTAMLEGIRPFFSEQFQGIETMEQALMLRGMGVPIIDETQFMAVGDVLAQNLAETKNLFEYVGLTGALMGQDAATIASSLNGMGYDTLDVPWVQQTMDAYNKMNAPQGGVGGGGRGQMPIDGDFPDPTPQQLETLAGQGILAEYEELASQIYMEYEDKGPAYARANAYEIVMRRYSGASIPQAIEESGMPANLTVQEPGFWDFGGGPAVSEEAYPPEEYTFYFAQLAPGAAANPEMAAIADYAAFKAVFKSIDMRPDLTDAQKSNLKQELRNTVGNIGEVSS